MAKNTIIYTLTDEAPALATHSLLPIIETFTKAAGINVEIKDISLAGRIISQFPERLTAEQQQPDALAELGEMAKTPDANIIKLPNISASIPQLMAAIQELKALGYDLPDFPNDPQNDEERAIKDRYAKVLGSAVNPVLREGNSDRRVAGPVKEYAQANPHSMGAWEATSKSHVAHMQDGDFYSSEQSQCLENGGKVKIEFQGADGTSKILKDSFEIQKGEVIDASAMSCKALRDYFDKEIQEAKDSGLLLSLHLKATMMKVSDPIIFGHAVSVFFKNVFERFSTQLEEVGYSSRLGLAALETKIEALPEAQKSEIKDAIQEAYAQRPPLAMVDSDKGITNLHVPSDIIIDASMPAAIRSSGKMWGPDGKLHDTKALIPDRCYAGVYQAVIEFCKENGAFDVTTMGNVSNVGLMAQKAEEYGSHDKTFEVPGNGKIRVQNESGETLFEHAVSSGDIWRMCQTKDAPIKDWIELALRRARATGSPAVFWLDEKRPHDASLIKKVNAHLPNLDAKDIEIHILAPTEAARFTLERVAAGKDTISVTGNVLRDYLTDLFPILELGTSAKMLSIVPLLNGGGLFETGAGGSAPKHVQQFQEENHLRWDSLGEFLALAVSLEEFQEKTKNARAGILAKGLDQATSQILNQGKSPSRKVKELDNRGSHFYLALYWSQALAEQTEDQELRDLFTPLASRLSENENKIVEELNSVQGQTMDIGGYYKPDTEKTSTAMRPSATFNSVLSSL